MNFRDFLESAPATVYHVSPEAHLKTIRPARARAKSGSKLGRGVFVAPKFKDALAWADSYVKHKKSSGQYKTLTIYTLQIPREILKTAYYAAWWEPEYFIPEELADQIQIVSSQTMTNKEIVSLYRRSLSLYWQNRQIQSNPSKIKELAKTNLAAKLYLDLFDRFAREKMTNIQTQDIDASGKRLDDDIKEALQTLKYMSQKPSKEEPFEFETKERLSKEEESMAIQIYRKAIERLGARQ